MRVGVAVGVGVGVGSTEQITGVKLGVENDALAGITSIKAIELDDQYVLEDKFVSPDIILEL